MASMGKATTLMVALMALNMLIAPLAKAHYSSGGGGRGGNNNNNNSGMRTKCPIDTLKLGACVDVLGGLVHVVLGSPKVNDCCPLIEGLADLELAACLCTTIRAKVLNLNLVVPLALQVLASCHIKPPHGFTCPTLL